MMSKTLLLIAVFACINLGATAGGGEAQEHLHLGIVPIGELPSDLTQFKSTDCGTDSDFDDCSATDAQGRKYVFFDGMLTRVSLKKSAAVGHVRLPAGILFGEKIDFSVRKIEEVLHIKMSGGKETDSRISYATDFVVGTTPTPFSLELIADHRRRLVEIVQRLDLP